jgi:hypothetical protein
LQIQRKRKAPAVRSAVLRKTRRSHRQATAGEAFQRGDGEDTDEAPQLKKEEGEQEDEEEVDTQEILLPENIETLTYETLCDQHWTRVNLPSLLWACHKEPTGKFVAFTHVSENTSSMYISTDKAVIFHGTLEAEIYVRGKEVTSQSFLQNAPVTMEELDILLRDVESLTLCKGTGLDVARYSPDCCLFLERKYRNSRCSNCSLKRTHLKKTEAQRLRRAAAKQKEPLKQQTSSKKWTKLRKEAELSEEKSSGEDFLNSQESHIKEEDEAESQDDDGNAEDT